jgi:hypothetical protein
MDGYRRWSGDGTGQKQGICEIEVYVQSEAVIEHLGYEVPEQVARDAAPEVGRWH